MVSGHHMVKSFERCFGLHFWVDFWFCFSLLMRCHQPGTYQYRVLPFWVLTGGTCIHRPCIIYHTLVRLCCCVLLYPFNIFAIVTIAMFSDADDLIFCVFSMYPINERNYHVNIN